MKNALRSRVFFCRARAIIDRSMKALFEQVVVLYNPNSTGNSAKNAKEFKQKLEQHSNGTYVAELRATEYPGHAEEIVDEYAQSRKRTLLVSSSGDGGYHEIINGVMNTASAKIVVSLLPSGNANDHYHAMRTDDFYDDICSGKLRKLDVIKISSVVDGKKWTRYAHSYAGIGFSAYIGKKLTASTLNAWNEKAIVAKGLSRFRYVTICENKTAVKYSSLILSSVGRMSKVLQLADGDSTENGKLEVSEIRYENPLHTMRQFVTMLFTNVTNRHAVEHFDFETTHKLSIQLDGEAYTLDAKSPVRINVERDAVKYIL